MIASRMGFTTLRTAEYPVKWYFNCLNNTRPGTKTIAVSSTTTRVAVFCICPLLVSSSTFGGIDISFKDGQQLAPHSVPSLSTARSQTLVPDLEDSFHLMLNSMHKWQVRIAGKFVARASTSKTYSACALLSVLCQLTRAFLLETRLTARLTQTIYKSLPICSHYYCYFLLQKSFLFFLDLSRSNFNSLILRFGWRAFLQPCSLPKQCQSNSVSSCFKIQLHPVHLYDKRKHNRTHNFIYFAQRLTSNSL